MPSAVIVQLIYESNTFCPRQAELEIFRDAGTWRVGEPETRAWADGVDSQMTGSVRALERAGWRTHPVFSGFGAAPAGRLSRQCHRTVRETIKAQIGRALSLDTDAVLMHLHGGMCAEGEDDVEGDLLQMVRQELGYARRLVLSLDLHANMTRRMAAHADAVTAYHTMPHMDFLATGERAARLAAAPGPLVRAVAKIKALVPPTDTTHFSGRFAAMLARARAEETPGEVDDVALLPVQAWMDIDQLAMAVVVTGRGPRPAAVARRLAEEWYAQRHQWRVEMDDWGEIVRKLTAPGPRPRILVDAADATTGGSEGYSAEAVQRLLPHAERLPGQVLLCVVDPAVVDQARQGERRLFRVGRPAVELEAEVVATGPGRYTTTGKLYPGFTFSMCGAAVLKRGQLYIVVHRQPSAAIDFAFYECLGLAPRQAVAVQTKCIQSWRAAFELGDEHGLFFDGPGCTSMNFARLPFTGARRGLFPIDPEPRDPITVEVFPGPAAEAS